MRSMTKAEKDWIKYVREGGRDTLLSRRVATHHGKYGDGSCTSNCVDYVIMVTIQEKSNVKSS